MVTPEFADPVWLETWRAEMIEQLERELVAPPLELYLDHWEDIRHRLEVHPAHLRCQRSAALASMSTEAAATWGFQTLRGAWDTPALLVCPHEIIFYASHMDVAVDDLVTYVVSGKGTAGGVVDGRVLIRAITEHRVKDLLETPYPDQYG